MGSPDLFRALTQTLRGEGAHAVTAEDARLTPYLSVVVAILYMMAVDGDISDRESSQLQSVIGADDSVLRRAVAYAQSHDVDSFLREAPALLDDDARLCLLVNVADSLMADGELQKVELLLFDRMLAAFGQTRASFQPHFDAIAAKGRTSMLGDFDAAAATDEMTPPKALVVAMLYMMSADGEMAAEEIGRLSAAIGGSQALLKASLRYVSQVRAPQFLALAAGLLDRRQRLCILLNACDAMMSDGEVDAAERDLFGRMMAAFGIDAASLDAYLNTIRLKNEAPHDEARPPARAASKASKISEASPVPALPPRRKKSEQGVVFERKRTWSEETGAGGGATPEARRSAAAREAQDPGEGPLDSRISRTMQDNIDRLSDSFDDEVTLATMERHSRGDDHKPVRSRDGDGPDELRAVTDGKGDKDLRSVADRRGNGDLRSTKDGKGASDLRAARDNEGVSDVRSARDGRGDSDSRTTGVGKGASDVRSARDGQGAGDLRAARDSQGASEVRSARDGKGESDSRAASDGKGPKALRTASDGEGDKDGRTASDGDGASDLRTATDADGPSDLRAARDAGARPDTTHLQDSGIAAAPPHWKDTGLQGEQRQMDDAGASPAAQHLVDDRRNFDADDEAGSEGPGDPDAIEGRMGDVRERTSRIRDHVEALQRSRSVRAGSRLPSLPPAPRPIRSADSEVPALAGAEEDPSTDFRSGDAAGMLFASDEGGPKMNEPAPPSGADEAKVNRKMRLRSAVLLPALFVTYGATMVGESISERLFMLNENIATDARIVHQMASVQQSIYRIAPEAVRLAPDALAVPVAVTAASGVATTTASGDVAPSDREKAEAFLEQRKGELVGKVRQHQASGAVAAEQQQWFIYAKSIVLLGLGMAFWGVLYRSLRMLNASTAAGLAGLLLAANGYWLLVRF